MQRLWIFPSRRLLSTTTKDPGKNDTDKGRCRARSFLRESKFLPMCKTARPYAISSSVDQSMYVHIQVTASKTSPDFRSGIVKSLQNTYSSYFNQFLPDNSVARGLTCNVAHILHSLLSQCLSPPLSPCSPIQQIIGYLPVVREKVGAEHSVLHLVWFGLKGLLEVV